MLSFENYPYCLIKESLSQFKHIVVSLVPFVRGRSFLVSKLALRSVLFDSVRYFKVKVKRIANITLIEIIILLVTCVPPVCSSSLCYCLCLFETICIHGAVNWCT